MVSTSPGDINASASRGFKPHKHGNLPIFSNDGSPNTKFPLQNSLHLPEGVVAKNSLQNGGEEGRSGAKPLSFKQVVQNERIIPQGAAFISDVTQEVSANKGDGGKVSIPSILVIKPNSQMNEVIELEKAKLQDCAIFFAVVDSSRVPSRNFLNDWFHKVWGQKLGFHFTYCRMLQKGLFILFFCDNKAQKAIVDKQFWRVGSCEFRAIPWTLEATQDEVLALSSPRWIILGNLPPFLLMLIPQALEPLGKVLRIDQSNTLIPNTDV